MGRVSQRIAGAALVAVAALVVSGCAWLYGLAAPYPYPIEPSPGPSAAYTTGKATVTIGKGAAISLAELTEGGTMDALPRASASFRNAAGWYVRILGAMKGASPYPTSFLTLERITDNQHWTTYDPSRCSVTVTKADATGLSGKASCTGLRWADALSVGVGSGYEPPYIKDQPAFDAEITFEAAPSTTEAG